jgi:AraC-like DNA-binding protein
MFLQIVELKAVYHNMPTPHSHDYYELYFQLEGDKRQLFIENKMYILPPKALCVIPPFCMHKMDGAAYRRININISKDLLSAEEIQFLDDCAKKIALKLDDTFLHFLYPLLLKGTELYNSNNVHSKQYTLPLVKTIFLFLQNKNFEIIDSVSITKEKNETDPLILKLILFINENYQSHLDLQMLCDKFFLSKATLCARFKKMMKCSIMDYTLNLRLSKARQMLLSQNSSIEEIADACGFSSSNYFRTSFKNALGVSPLQYRKDIRGEKRKFDT